MNKRDARREIDLAVNLFRMCWPTVTGLRARMPNPENGRVELDFAVGAASWNDAAEGVYGDDGEEVAGTTGLSLAAVNLRSALGESGLSVGEEWADIGDPTDELSLDGGAR